MVRTAAFQAVNRSSILRGATIMTKVLIEVSARHLHLSQTDLNKLFGAGYKLKILKRLSQSGEFAAKETVALVGAKGVLKSVRIVGPTRAKTQVEVSLTDAQTLGLKPPLRISGDLRSAAKIKIIGPAGEITAPAAIVALRHLHINPVEAKRLKLINRQTIKIAVKGNRQIIFDKVLVRVGKNYKLALHLDTDEANAAGLGSQPNYGQIV